MKGFSLKKDVNSAPKKKFGGFSLSSKKQVNTIKKVSVLGDDSNTNDGGISIGQKVAIDSIDQIDSNGDKAEKELTIVPVVNGNNWEARRRRALEEQKKKGDSTDADNKMSFGLNLANNKPKSVGKTSGTEDDAVTQDTKNTAFTEEVVAGPEATKESYEKIPVGMFGAAMLRGMGWKGDEDKGDKRKVASSNSTKPRLPFLGLGAKASAEQEDSSYRYTSKEYVPVKLVERQDRDKAEHRDRERSPRRST